MTYHEATSTTFLNHAWCIAAQGDTVHLVWDDDAEGCWEIYARCSYDGGVNWGDVIRLSDSTAGWEIFHICSQDTGHTWGGEQRLTIDPAVSWFPSVAVSDTIVHVL